MEAAKDEVILAELGKLSLHFWRPDFTPSQAKLLYADYLEDLRPFTIADIREAIADYRQDGRARFFPTSGQLIETMLPPRDASVPDRENTRAKVLRYMRLAGEDEVRARVLAIENKQPPVNLILSREDSDGQ